MPSDIITRRRLLKSTAISGVVGTAGCSGQKKQQEAGGDGGSSGDGGSGGSDGQQQTTDTGADISKPWTVEELRQKSKEEAEANGGKVDFTVYSTTDVKKMGQLVDAVKKGVDAPWIKFNGVAGNGNKMVTRFLEEYRQGKANADFLQVRAIFPETDNPGKYIESNFREKFAVAEKVPDYVIGDVQGGGFLAFKEGGSSVNILYNTELIKKENIDLGPLKKKGYAAFHENDEYKGLNMAQDFTPKERLMGWWASTNGEKLGMSPIEYAKMMNDRFNWKWTDGHSASSRTVGAGGAHFQLLTIPDHYVEFQDKGLPVDIVQPEPVPKFVPPGGAASIPNNSKAPWTARLVAAGLYQPEVQRLIPKLAKEPPVRSDIEYPDMDPRLTRLLKTKGEKIQPETKQKWMKLSPKIMEKGFGSPSPT